MQHPTSPVPHKWENSEGIKLVRGIKSLSRRTDCSSWKAISTFKGKTRSIRNLTLYLRKGMDVLWAHPAHEHGSRGGPCRLLLRRWHQRWTCPLPGVQFLALETMTYEPYSTEPKKDGHYSSPGLKTRHAYTAFTCTGVSRTNITMKSATAESFCYSSEM